MNSNEIMPLVYLGLGTAVILLFARPGFRAAADWLWSFSWIIGFFVGGLASLFATLASIIHFEILGALGFFFLMVICWGLMVVGFRGYEARSDARASAYQRERAQHAERMRRQKQKAHDQSEAV